MKYIIIVPDGMADHPIESMGNKTPLEVAHTTNMDFMAQKGYVGLVRTIPEGMKPGSDIGNLALLGYDPKTCFSGRAPLEAANQNIILREDEIAFRCNLVTLVDNTMADYSAGHISDKEAALLIEALNKELETDEIKFYAGKSYRHLLILKVRNVKDFLSIKTAAPHDILNKDIKSFLPQGAGAQLLLRLMEQSKKTLESHSINQVRIDLKENPATMIWLWGQGVAPHIPIFEEKFGLKGSIISAVDLVNGIGRLAGLEVIDVPGITGYYDTNYLGKAEYALKSLKKKDFVYIHIEATDEAGHNGDLKAKIECIEKIDRDIVGTVLNHFNPQDDVRILLLPDHPTPVEVRTHTDEPVCFVMYGKGIPHDGVESFHEATAKEKGLKFDSGESLVDYFIKKNL